MSIAVKTLQRHIASAKTSVELSIPKEKFKRGQKYYNRFCKEIDYNESLEVTAKKINMVEEFLFWVIDKTGGVL